MERRGLVDILREVGEGSTLHGVPKIVSANHVVIKTVWALIVIGASVLLGLQMSALFGEYYSYPTKTSISVKYGALPFPSVTVCNMNPFKESKLDTMPTVKNAIDSYRIQSSGQSQERQSSGQSQERQSSGQSRERQSSGQSQERQSSGQQHEIQSSSQQHERSKNQNNASSSKGSQDAKSDWEKWRLGVLIEYRKLEQSVRLNGGQEMDEFIIKRTFNEEPISSSMISPVLSFNNGKCYTIDMENAIVTAGPYNGLSLTSFLDRDEYIKELVKGYGATVLIHEPGTFPVPGEEGYILNPGHQTNIAIKTKIIHRLGYPHGDCVVSSNFHDKYGFNYTTPVCFTTCVKAATERACNCTPYLAPEKINDTKPALDICEVKNQCSSDVRRDFFKKQASCNCNSRCQESVYSLTFSSRQWPQPTYLEQNVLADACKNQIPSLTKICTDIGMKQNITHENYKDFAEHFLNINIYYDSLVYEEIVESSLYSTIGFLSDIGGSMGLFMGASLMTYLELLHLLAELFVYIYLKCTRGRSKVTQIQPLKKLSIVEIYDKKPDKDEKIP